MKWFDDIKKYYLYRGLNKRFILPIVVLYMLDVGLNVQEIALIASVAAIVAFILEVPSGSLADTLGHKKALILAAIGQSAAMLLYLGGSFPWILAGSVAYFATGSLMTGTHDALIFERLIELKKESFYRKLLGRARAFADGWSMVTIVFAGLLYAMNPAAPFIVGSALFAIGAIVISQFQQAKKQISVEKQEGFREMFAHFKQAIKTVKENRALLFLMLTNGLIFSVGIASTEFQQVIFSDIGLAAGLFGVIYALKRLTSVVISVQLHAWTKNLQPITVLSFMGITMMLYLLLIGSVSNHVGIALIVLLATLNFTIADIVIRDYANRMIPTGSRATTHSLRNFYHQIVKLVVILVIGTVTVVTSIQMTHIWIAAGLGVLLLVFLPLTQRAYSRA